MNGLDERLGDVEDELHDVVAGVGHEQEQDDPQDQQRLQDAEQRTSRSRVAIVAPPGPGAT